MSTTPIPSLPRRMLLGWTAIAMRFGSVQTLVMLSLFYVALLGPVALAMALARRDHLGRRGLRVDGTTWRDADTSAPDLERAKLLS